MPALALAGVNVLDLSLSLGGAYCTKLLADLGADVIAIEPLDGHPLRRRGPFPGGQPHPDTGGMFRHLFSNKSAITLDLADSGHRQRALTLAKGANIVVESSQPGELAKLGLDWEALRTLQPSLVYTSLTHFGQTGSYRDWEGEEIVDWALGGYMYFGGSPDRAPLMVPQDQAMFHGGAQAAVATLAALRWSEKTGRGQQVDVSTVEAVLSAHLWTVGSWTHGGRIMRRAGSEVMKCKDGWVRFLAGRFDPVFFILMDRPDLVDDPRFADRAAWTEHSTVVSELLHEWCLGQTKEDIFRRGQALRIPVTPVYDAADLVDSPELREREWFLDAGERLRMPGFPFKLSETPPKLRTNASTLGSSRENRLTPAPQRRPGKGGGTPVNRLALEGVRVLEVTGNWAGPYAGRLLADLGAEVIKAENPSMPRGRAVMYAGNQPLRHHYNRSAYFNKLNRNKQSLTLDLSKPEGREVFLRLVEMSDVVLENNSPRVMRNLSIDYESLQEVNPQIIMASISAFGPTGVAGDYVAYGANIEASCGLAAVMGYPEEEQPYQTGLYYADPITASHTAVAILAALRYRDETGKGQHIDMSLQENGIAFFVEPLLEYLITKRKPVRRGNRHAQYAPQGCYPSVGEDMWVVMCIRSDAEWTRFCRLAGIPELMAEEFTTVAGRREHHDRFDALIGIWTAQYDHNEAAAMLQAEGIPAAPVLANWELVSNRHFHDRGFYQTVVHDEMGVFSYPGMPWKLEDTPGTIRSAAPLYGEQNGMILKNLLGVDQRELAFLYDEGIVADIPPPTIPPPAPLAGL